MNKENKDYETEMAKRAEESKQSTFDSWVDDLEEGEQPEQCSVDNPDCENCGS